MIDYAISNLGFYIGTSIPEMQLAMSKTKSTELLDCFGSINRLITTLNKISNPEAVSYTHLTLPTKRIV